MGGPGLETFFEFLLLVVSEVAAGLDEFLGRCFQLGADLVNLIDCLFRLLNKPFILRETFGSFFRVGFQGLQVGIFLDEFPGLTSWRFTPSRLFRESAR